MSTKKILVDVIQRERKGTKGIVFFCLGTFSTSTTCTIVALVDNSFFFLSVRAHNLKSKGYHVQVNPYIKRKNSNNRMF